MGRLRASALDPASSPQTARAAPGDRVPYGRVERLSRMAVDSDSAQLHIFRPIGEGQSMLSTLNVLERVRAAKNRARVRAELIAAGLQPADADAWCDRWESEARRKTLHAGAHDFWTLGSAWIKERQRQP